MSNVTDNLVDSIVQLLNEVGCVIENYEVFVLKAMLRAQSLSPEQVLELLDIYVSARKAARYE